MGTRDGQQKGAQKRAQKGAQRHAEGDHGEKTRSRFLKQIHEPMHRDEETAENDGASESGGDDRQRR